MVGKSLGGEEDIVKVHQACCVPTGVTQIHASLDEASQVEPSQVLHRIPVLARFGLLVVLCVVTGVTALWLFGITGPGQTTTAWQNNAPIDMWLRWDCGWYQAIAERGYSYTPGQQSAVAYFPLYPLLMRGVMAFGVDVFLSGIAVTLVSGGLGALVFHQWARTLKPGAADWALTLFLTWPFAYYLAGAVYSDALFLLVVACAFLFLERRQLGWAVLLGALATATRPVGPAVVLGLCARAWELDMREGKPSWKTALPLLSGAGALAYMVYLGVAFGDPLAFLHSQAGWGQLTNQPGFKPALFNGHRDWPEFVSPLIHLTLALGLLALAWPMRKRLGWGYSVYVAAVLALPLYSSRDFIGLGRYGIAAFPSLLVLAETLREKPRWVRLAYVASSVALLVVMTARFAIGRYVS